MNNFLTKPQRHEEEKRRSLLCLEAASYSSLRHPWRKKRETENALCARRSQATFLLLKANTWIVDVSALLFLLSPGNAELQLGTWKRADRMSAFPSGKNRCVAVPPVNYFCVGVQPSGCLYFFIFNFAIRILHFALPGKAIAFFIAEDFEDREDIEDVNDCGEPRSKKISVHLG